MKHMVLKSMRENVTLRILNDCLCFFTIKKKKNFTNQNYYLL